MIILYFLMKELKKDIIIKKILKKNKQHKTHELIDGKKLAFGHAEFIA